MNEWAGLFLGVLALTPIIQCVFLVTAALALRSSAQRVNEVCEKFDAEIKPTLDDLRKGASNLRAISDSGREQAARVEALLSTTIANIETTIESVRSLVAKPLASLSEIAALWGGLRGGIEAFRSTAPKTRPQRAAHRRSEESDEHLFIG